VGDADVEADNSAGGKVGGNPSMPNNSSNSLCTKLGGRTLSNGLVFDRDPDPDPGWAPSPDSRNGYASSMRDRTCCTAWEDASAQDIVRDPLLDEDLVPSSLFEGVVAAAAAAPADKRLERRTTKDGISFTSFFASWIA